MTTTPADQSLPQTPLLPHLLVVGGIWPSEKAPTEAACMVTFLCLQALAQSKKFRLTYCYVSAIPQAISPEMGEDLDRLRDMGITIAEPVIFPLPPRNRERPVTALINILRGTPEKLFSGYGLQQMVLDVCDNKPDAIFTIWAEMATILTSQLDIPHYSFYGNPDHKVLDAFLTLKRLSTDDENHWLKKLIHDAMVKVQKTGHLNILRRLTHIYEVAANDADLYSSFGLSVEYLPNIWSTETIDEDWPRHRDALEVTEPLRIIASVGRQVATGNSYGFYTLATEVLPALKKRLGEGTFELHIFGGGEPRDFLRPMLNDPHVVRRGFVDNIDKEILSAPIFLLPHNHEKFKVGHTRILHAWSLGACVVAFQDSREPMPEIVHGENALLAEDADGLAEMVAKAAADKPLRRRLGAQGMETLRTNNSKDVICHRLVNSLAGRVTHKE